MPTLKPLETAGSGWAFSKTNLKLPPLGIAQRNGHGGFVARGCFINHPAVDIEFGTVTNDGGDLQCRDLPLGRCLEQGNRDTVFPPAGVGTVANTGNKSISFNLKVDEMISSGDFDVVGIQNTDPDGFSRRNRQSISILKTLRLIMISS